MTAISLHRPDSDDELLGGGLAGWQALQLPRFHESRHLRPGGAGWLAAAAFEQAGFAYAGGLSDVSRLRAAGALVDGVDRVRAHPGRAACRPARTTGSGCAARSGRSPRRPPSASAGSLCFGVVGDSDTASPFLVSGFDTPVATPVRAATAGPHARRLRADGEQVIEGSVPVEADAIPSMAFVLGTDVLLHDGWAAIERGGVSRNWIERVGPPGGAGSIEYRYEPHEVADTR